MSTQPPPTDHAPQPGPTSGSRGFRAFSEVRRSRDDRMVAGVCDGVARRFDIDPVVVRVVTVVLCFVGLSGLILYVAGWLLLPAEDEPRSHVGAWFGLDSTEAQVRDTGLVVAAVLALLGVLGDGGWGWGGSGVFWFAVLVGGPVAFVVWLLRRARRGDRPDVAAAGPTPYDAPPTPPAGDDAVGWPQRREDTVALEIGTGVQQPPADVPPPTTRRSIQPEPPREPREPYSWIPTLLTLSSVAIALAVLRLVADPAWPAYAAVALAVVGLALVLCTFTRGGAPIILLGLALLPVLVAGTLVPSLRGGEQLAAPTSAAQVQDRYTHGVGRLEIDLSDVSDPDALVGRTIDVEMGVGETVVIVPEGVPVVVEASVGAGDLQVLDERRSGVSQRIRTPGSGPALTIDVDQSLGRVEVDGR